MFRRHLLALGLAATTGVLAGCDHQQPTPLSPTPVAQAAAQVSGQSPGVSGQASTAPGQASAEDGSTLKATAPIPQSPAGGVRVSSIRPELVIQNGQPKYVEAALRYRFEVSDEAGKIDYLSDQVDEGSGTTQHEATRGLEYDTNYRWRARAELEDAFGPWSSFALFTTPPFPAETPEPVEPAGGQTTTNNRPAFVVRNGGVNNPAGPVVYHFEVADDPVFAKTVMVGTSPRSPGLLTTASLGQFAYDHVFYWRVNASDGKVTSPWSSVASFRTPLTPPVLAHTKFLAFGDSFTYGVVSLGPTLLVPLAPTSAYPSRLEAMLNLRYHGQTIVVDNGGVPGEWAENGAARLPTAMGQSRPEVVLLLEGVNDVAALGANGVASAASALTSMVRRVKSSSADCLLATTPPQRVGSPKAVDTALLTQLNDKIRGIASSEGATLVDLYNILDLGDIGADGVHLTEAGYERMAQAFMNTIQKAYEKPPTTTSTR